MFLLFWFIFFIHVVTVSFLPPLYIFGFFGLFEIIIFSLVLAYFIKYRELDICKISFKLLGTLYLMEIVANILNSIILLTLINDFSLDNIIKMFSSNFLFGSIILVVLPLVIIFIFSKLSDTFYYKLKYKRYLHVEILFTIVIVLTPYFIYQKQLEVQDKKSAEIALHVEKNIFKSSYDNQVIETSLKYAIWRYVAKYNKNQKEDTEFYLTYYDLDRDGDDEAFVYLNSDGFCSNGSCRVVVFRMNIDNETHKWSVSAMLPMAKKELYIDVNTTLRKKDFELLYRDIYTEISKESKPNKMYLHYTHHLGESKMVRYLKHNREEFSKFEREMNNEKYFQKLEFKKFDHIDLGNYFRSNTYRSNGGNFVGF